LSLVAVSEREESEGTDYAYRISFTVLDCQQCGGQRLATRSCPECGALPDDGETDPVLEQRRQAATLALDLLHAPLSEVSSELELGSLLDAAGTISPRFLSAFRDVAAGIETDELLIAVASLRELRAQVEHDRPRPWRSLGRSARELLGDVSLGFERLLNALIADDVPLIEEEIGAAQSALDSAAIRMERISDDADALDRFFDATPDDALPLICELALRNLPEPEDDSSRIFELDAFGAGYVRRITGPESEPSTGFGTGIMLSVVAIEVLLDVERVYQVAGQAYQDYLRGERLEELGANPEWVARQHDVQKWMQAGIRNLHALVAIARDDWAAARAVLLHAQDLIEGPVRHLLATYLAITKGREYQQLVSRDSNSLLQQCRQSAADHLFGDISEDLRNASAHLRYRIDGEHIVLDPDRRPVRWSASTFIDKALATAETALALDLALACALDHFGHDTAISPDLTALGFDEAGQGLAVLIMTGWKEPTFEIQGDRATATGVALMNEPMTLTGSLLPSLPDDVRILELSVRSGGATRTFVADLTPLRRYAALPPSPDDTIGEHELAFVEGCAQATLDGRPFASRDALRHYVAVLVGEAIVGEPSAAIGRLKQLRDFANRLDDHECAQAIFEVIRAVRLRVMGHGFDAAARHGIDVLAEWEAMTVDSPFET
jgi:hypothetical protein